jgi:hypothetical protein
MVCVTINDNRFLVFSIDDASDVATQFIFPCSMDKIGTPFHGEQNMNIQLRIVPTIVVDVLQFNKNE